MNKFHIGSLDDGLNSGFIGRSDSVVPGRYFAEASTLGLPVGGWPDVLTIQAFGREISLKRIKFIADSENELFAVIYDSCGDGLIQLKVFND